MKYKQIKNEFWKDDRYVYCERRKIRGANPKTFQVLGDSWAKDDKHAYYAMFMVRKSDPATFIRLNGLYAKDKNFAYGAYGHIVEDADPDTFEVLDTSIPTAKLFEFKILGHEGYARDKNHVFYNVSAIGRPTIIKGANPKTFISLGNEYGRDDKSVFCEKSKVQGADISSWRYLGWWYSMDKKRVYFRNKAIPNADMESFILLEPFDVWAKDKNHYCMNGTIQDKNLYIEELERKIENIKWIITNVKSGGFDSLHLSHTYDSFLPPKEV